MPIKVMIIEKIKCGIRINAEFSRFTRRDTALSARDFISIFIPISVAFSDMKERMLFIEFS